jgi:hypothetical protein
VLDAAAQLLPSFCWCASRPGCFRPLCLSCSTALLPPAPCRLEDGFDRYAPFTPSPAGGPVGVYQLTPNVTALAYPQIATTQPLVLTSPSQVCGWPGCTPAGRRHAGPLHRSL